TAGQENPGSARPTAAAAAAAAAAGGPPAQGRGRSPSAPGRDRDCSPEGRRRPAKRRASGSQESPQPPKRPSRRPRMHEKNSCVCPVLAGRRTEKWLLWIYARIPQEMEPREEQRSAPLQACTGQESQREPGHKWCLGG
ncbi:unnamed protein product, partial [Coccothraustes coccothraustes]